MTVATRSAARLPFRCRASHNNLYVNELFFRVSPCCYLVNTPGYDEVRLKDTDVVSAWNAPSFQELATGSLTAHCLAPANGVPRPGERHALPDDRHHRPE